MGVISRSLVTDLPLPTIFYIKQIFLKFYHFLVCNQNMLPTILTINKCRSGNPPQPYSIFQLLYQFKIFLMIYGILVDLCYIFSRSQSLLGISTKMLQRQVKGIQNEQKLI